MGAWFSCDKKQKATNRKPHGCYRLTPLVVKQSDWLVLNVRDEKAVCSPSEGSFFFFCQGALPRWICEIYPMDILNIPSRGRGKLKLCRRNFSWERFTAAASLPRLCASQFNLKRRSAPGETLFNRLFFSFSC